MASAKDLLARMFRILECDHPILHRVDAYYRGCHDDPYMPKTADAEYRLLASRATSNWMPLLVATPAQALYVDGFRPSRSIENPTENPEWAHWQRSRMDARQTAVHRGALKHGHSFVVTEMEPGSDTPRSRGLSALRTAALYTDPANDIAPYAAMTVEHWPLKARATKSGTDGGYGQTEATPGSGWMWDATNKTPFTFLDLCDTKSIKSGKPVAHGAGECPITRFAAAVDLEGRTVGVIEPMIELQNRINQTVFDLLVAQTYGSFKVRWVTGMAPPIKRDPETGQALVDADGNPVPSEINLSPRRMMFGENSDVKFGTLDGTPLEGYISSIDMAIRHLAAVSQTPPTYLLGEIANLSADALQAAETSLARKSQEFRVNFGESWERVFRIAGALSGDQASAGDEAGEVVWRDMESRSMAQIADALGKMRQSLEIPARALWEKFPGVTQTELSQWDEYADKEDAELQLANSLNRLNTGLGGGTDSGNGQQQQPQSYPGGQ